MHNDVIIFNNTFQNAIIKNLNFFLFFKFSQAKNTSQARDFRYWIVCYLLTLKRLVF